MLRENERLYNNAFAMIDTVITVLSFALAYYMRVYIVAKTITFADQYLILGILIIPIWFILSNLLNIRNEQKVQPYSVVLIEYGILVGTGVTLLFIFIFILKLENISRIGIFIFAFSNYMFLSINKIVIFKIIKKRTAKGKNLNNVIIIADKSSESFINKIVKGKFRGLNIHSIISDDLYIIDKYSQIFTIITLETDISEIIDKNPIDEIIYCKNEVNTKEVTDLIYICREVGVTFQIHSDFFNLIASKSHINYFGETPLISFKSTPTDYFALTLKSVIDYIFSFIVLVIFFPILLVIALLIKLETHGPILFKQKRIGLRGRTFTMYKFRTMVNNAETIKRELIELNECDGPVFKMKNDPRITVIGKFLRMTSLDEFPQFYNVLKGEMSIVGPRPPLKEEVDKYERHQLRRLSMKPGITCIWQVSGRNSVNFNDWMKLDLQYIDNWSLKLDLVLIIKTLHTIIKRTGY
jgi:exopolysaccharide biosynthesis polyprenyl glycosylphosphotransferase